MADAVTSQTLRNGAELVMLFTNLSDGTGEADVVKVDVSALSLSKVEILRIQYDIYGCELTMKWDATTDVIFAVLNGSGDLDFRAAPIVNNAGAGVTGDVMFDFTGSRADAGDSYTVILTMRKIV
jgi:hypothetical protein